VLYDIPLEAAGGSAGTAARVRGGGGGGRGGGGGGSTIVYATPVENDYSGCEPPTNSTDSREGDADAVYDGSRSTAPSANAGAVNEAAIYTHGPHGGEAAIYPHGGPEGGPAANAVYGDSTYAFETATAIYGEGQTGYGVPLTSEYSSTTDA
jgi:hypothetical protein